MPFRFSLSTSYLWSIGFCLLASSAGCGGGSGLSPQPTNVSSSIAFISTRDGAPEIYTMNPDGSQQTRVTTGIGNANNPSQSRDGRIAFESNRDGNSEIYVVNRDGSGLQRLTNDMGAETFDDVQPAFSPDGKTIAWASTNGNSKNHTTNIWLMNSDGKNKRQFVFNTTPTNGLATIGSRDPAWTPDSKKLAYIVIPQTSSPLANNAIQLKTLATGEVTDPNYSFGSGSHLRFNNGRKIIYSSPFSRTNGAFLSTYDFNSGAMTQVPVPQNAETFNRSPDYSPEGQSIVWDAIIDKKPAQIYRANADGSVVTALTTQGENYSPDW